MNKENLIKINGGSYDEVKKALRQWIVSYSDKLKSNLKFEIYKTNNESYLITADKRINNENFNYLINYLRYPEGIEYDINIEGYVTARDEKVYPKNLLNKKLIVYVPEDDKEFDNVFVTTEDNETYKIEFGTKPLRQYEFKAFKIPDYDTSLLQKPERISLTKQERDEIETEKAKKSIKKRFIIILSFTIITTIINSLSLFVIPENKISSLTTLILILGVAVWFHWDYKMLRINEYYRNSIIVAVVFLCYGFVIKDYLPEKGVFTAYGFWFPIIFLIIQKPLRLFFIHQFKREPIIERESSLWDATYGILLIAVTIGIIYLMYIMA